MKIFPVIKLLRPTQWLKNLMLLFPPFLGGVMFDVGVARTACMSLIAFCMASSATYILNDFLDMENDANHAVKKLRPLAAGTVSIQSASILGVGLALASIGVGAYISTVFILILLAYVSVSAIYSIKLKEFALVDLFCISTGFLLRLEAGGVAFRILISEWLFLSVFLLSVFLSTGKRLGEKSLLGSTAVSHRKSLLGYPDGFLDGIMYMTGSAVLVTYTMYVISRHFLVYSVPLCSFGLMRYIFLVKAGIFGDPTESLVKDRVLFVVGLCWAIMIGFNIYF